MMLVTKVLDKRAKINQICIHGFFFFHTREHKLFKKIIQTVAMKAVRNSPDDRQDESNSTATVKDSSILAGRKVEKNGWYHV